jgi:hypothetical protein
MDADWAAVMDSEVFRNYLQGELRKEAAEKAAAQIAVPETVEEQPVVEAFAEFEEKVKRDPKMLFTFRQLQKKIASDPDYAHSCNPLFAQAVMMLDLDE